ATPTNEACTSAPTPVPTPTLETTSTPTTTPISKWSCVNGFSFPMKIASDGNIECWSNNGRECYVSANCAAVASSNTKPPTTLVCGCKLLALLGYTGYNDPNHWCNAGKTALGASPPNEVCTSVPTTTIATPIPSTTPIPQWTCIKGLASPMKIASDGNIECWSNDGKNCAWNVNCDALVASNTEPKAPLVCGCKHLAVWGSTGYNNATHWCNMAKAALGASPTNEACTVAPTPAKVLNMAAAAPTAPNNTLLVFASMLTGAGLALAAVALNNYRRRIPSTKEERQTML
ncbi:hypothetical protein As57867_003854, partial [Aphanomyces stellatus]